MAQIMNFPIVIFIFSLLGLWACAQFGMRRRRKLNPDQDGEREEFGTVLGATLTLLGLLIGFSFSMAISRYDQRKNYEEEEANAIGTEFLRADLLADADRTKVQQQLAAYLDLRIAKYEAHAADDTSELDAKTAGLENGMWSDVRKAALANPTPVMSTVVTGMNDVINRHGYSQAARLNRIPLPAWGLMISIALFSNFLIGFGARKSRGPMLWIVPLAVSLSFFLIADIDSSRGGLIRIHSQNLNILADSLRPK
jgi:hypothetical protein